jgi:hypothetical protein
VPDSSSRQRRSRKKKRFNLHHFFLKAKLLAVEIASAIVFFWFLFHILTRELR